MRPPPEPTEYAKNRPRRETARTAMALGHTTESLELVKCCDFVGPPGSGAPLAQPFQVEVDAQVSAVCAPPAFVRSAQLDYNVTSLERRGDTPCPAALLRGLPALLHSVQSVRAMVLAVINLNTLKAAFERNPVNM